MILRDSLNTKLNLYESKSHQILSEGVWRQLDEDTKSYVNRWEKELWPLLEEYQSLSEAELTVDQITAIFGNAEKIAVDSGKYKTKLGQAGLAAQDAGKAVVGGVKIAADVMKQINNKVNELGKVIQDTAPVQGLDQAFEKAKLDLNTKLGGKDSKVNKAIAKMAEAAKDNPGKTKFLIALLTTAAAFSAGPAGGAAAGFVLRLGNDLLAGDKLSTAVGKGAKTAVAGFLAGKAFEFLGGELKDMFSSGVESDLATATQSLQDATVDEYTKEAIAQGGPAKELWNQTFPDGSVDMSVSTTGTTGNYFSGNVIMTNDQYEQYNALKDAASQFKSFSDEAVQQTAKAYNYIEQIKATTDQATLMQIKDAGIKASNAIFDAGQAALEDPGLQAEISALTGDAAKDIAKMAKITDIASALGQGAATAATIPGKKAEPEAEEKPKAESIDYQLLYTKHLAGIPLNEAEQQLVNEIGLADIKRGAAKAAAVVGGAAKKAGGALVGKAKETGKELGNSITVKKLTALWNKAKKPTDSQSIANILAQGGMEPEDIATAGPELPAPTAPTAKPEPEEQPQGGTQPEQPQGGQPEQPQGGQPEQPQGGAQPEQPQGGAQGTQGQQSGAQGTTSGPTGGSAGGSGAIGKGVQQAQSGDTEEPDLPELTPGKSETINKIKFTWDGTGWKDPQGRSAQGAMQQDLMAKYGRNGDGTPLKNPGLIQRAKDYMSGKTPGLAQKTRLDPKASTGKKLAGMAGAAIGGMFGKSGGGQQAEPGTPEQPEQPAQPGEPAQPQGQQAQPQAQQPAQGAPKAVPGPTTAELKMLQSKTLQGDLASAKALVAKLSELKSKGYDADKFIQAAAPVMKKGGLAKSDPQAYATFVKMARSMRAEAYEHMCAILEHAGLTWADIGYEVLISESVTSHVMLIPTDIVQMSEMKKLAGI